VDAAQARPPRAPLLLFGASLAVILHTWPLAIHPFRTLGHPLGEADNHAWMFWKSAVERLGAPTALFNYPAGSPLPLMDPVNLPLYLLGAWIDPALGYNLVAFACGLLGVLAGYALCREWCEPGPSFVGGLVAGCSPFLAGVMDFGITEAWPLYLLSLHLLFLRRLLVRGGLRNLLASGALLAAFACSGWYHAFFVLPVEILLLAFWCVETRRWRGALLQGLLALVLVLPQFVRFWSQRGLWSERWRVPTALPLQEHALWRSRPLSGTDLLLPFLPDPGSDLVSQTSYLGLGVLLLCLVALLRRRRSAFPFLLASLPLLLLSLGYVVRVAGHPVQLGPFALAGPAWHLVHLFPDFAGLTHWYRAIGPITVLLAVPAALGAQRLRDGRLSPLLALLVLLDGSFLGHTGWPRAMIEPRPPALYLELPEPGPLVELPFDNARRPFTDEIPRRSNRWQPFHGHPVAENYEGRDELLFVSPLVSVADRLCGRTPVLPASQIPPETMRDPSRLADDASLETARQQLAAMGVTWILVSRDDCPGHAAVEVLLDRAFGPARLDHGDRFAHRVTSAQ
jgi:MYXO-CTERM domain-containing protein